MLLADYIAAVEEELDTTDTDKVTRLFNVALKIYSFHCPRRVVEQKTSVEDSYEVDLDEVIMSSAVRIYYLEDTKRYFIDSSSYIVHELDGFIEFDYPLNKDTIYVEYYTDHSVTEAESTIPVQHEQAVVWLTCHLVNQYDLFGTDMMEYIDNGIMRVRFNVTETQNRQRETYLNKYYDVVKANKTVGEVLIDSENGIVENTRSIYDYVDYDDIGWWYIVASKLVTAANTLQEIAKDYGKKATIYTSSTTTDTFGEPIKGSPTVEYSNLSLVIKRKRFPPPALVNQVKVEDELYEAIFNLYTDDGTEVTLTTDKKVVIDNITYKILNVAKEISGWYALLLRE